MITNYDYVIFPTHQADTGNNWVIFPHYFNFNSQTLSNHQSSIGQVEVNLQSSMLLTEIQLALALYNDTGGQKCEWYDQS
jgi:hypothetical protein